MNKVKRMKRLLCLIVLPALILLSACGAGPSAPTETPRGFGSYLVVGSDMGKKHQNLRITQNGQIEKELSVKVNGIKIPFSTVGYPGYHGELFNWLSEGDKLKLEVTTPSGRITATDVIPEKPVMTAPATGITVDVAQPLEVTWTSVSDPDRFLVSATWSCGTSCGTGKRFDAAGDERSLTIPGGELPADTAVKVRVYAYNDGADTFTGHYAKGSRMAIRHGDEVGADITTISSAACTDSVTFADANLEAAIREKLGVTGAISKSDLESLRSLPAAERNITSLEGLQCAVNLKIANLSQNNISDLTPLKDLTKLDRLVLTVNNVSDVSPLAGLTDLIQLYLARNPVSDISSLETLTKMRLLTLDYTNVTDISTLSNYPNLGLFHGAGMGFSSLEPLRDLDELYSLRIRNNNISDLEPLRGKRDLRTIDLGGNNISDPGVLGTLPQLTTLFLFNNPIDNSKVAGLSGATNLQYLHMMATGLNGLEFVRPLTNLKSLIVNVNSISDLSPVAGLSNLEALNVQLNQISDISPVASLSKLRNFYALTNRISDLSPLTSLPLDRITLGGNLVSDLGPLVANSNLVRGDYIEVTRNCLHVAGDDKADIEALEERLGTATTARVGFNYANQRRSCQL